MIIHFEFMHILIGEVFDCMSEDFQRTARLLVNASVPSSDISPPSRRDNVSIHSTLNGELCPSRAKGSYDIEVGWQCYGTIGTSWH